MRCGLDIGGGVGLVSALRLGYWWWRRILGGCGMGVVGHYFKRLDQKHRWWYRIGECAVARTLLVV